MSDATVEAYTAEYSYTAAKARIIAAQKLAYDRVMVALLAEHDAGVILSDEAYRKLAKWI